MDVCNLPWVVLLILMLSSSSYGDMSLEPSPVQRLWKDVLQGYNKHIRPKYNNSEAITLVHNVRIYQILEVNERQQYIKLSLWLDQIYRNEFIGWNPDDYEGIDKIEINEKEIWTPDIFVYNSIDFDAQETTQSTNSWVVARYFNKPQDNFPNNNATGFWGSAVIRWYPMIGKFSCIFNTLYFPYDTQNCQLIFGSWSYPMDGINMKTFQDQVDMSEFILSEEWDIINFTMRREVKKYTCCPTPYSIVIAELMMQRKPLYYVINLILPTVVIAQVAFLGFFSGGGGERSERVGLGMDTLVAMSILLIIVSSLMPITSSYVPMTGLFIFVAILMIAIGVLATCCITHIHNRCLTSNKVPPWVRRTFFRVGPWLLVDVRGARKTPSELELRQRGPANSTTQTTSLLSDVPMDEHVQEGRVGVGGHGGRNDIALENNGKLSQNNHHTCGHGTTPGGPVNDEQILRDHLLQVKKDIEGVKEHINLMDTDLFYENNEWKTMAMILDRMMLILLSAVLWMNTAAILLVRSVSG